MKDESPSIPKSFMFTKHETILEYEFEFLLWVNNSRIYKTFKYLLPISRENFYDLVNALGGFKSPVYKTLLAPLGQIEGKKNKKKFEKFSTNQNVQFQNF